MQITPTNTAISGDTGPKAIRHYSRAITLSYAALAQNAGMGLNLHATRPRH